MDCNPQETRKKPRLQSLFKLSEVNNDNKHHNWQNRQIFKILIIGFLCSIIHKIIGRVASAAYYCGQALIWKTLFSVCQTLTVCGLKCSL